MHKPKHKGTFRALAQHRLLLMCLAWALAGCASESMRPAATAAESQGGGRDGDVAGLEEGSASFADDNDASEIEPATSSARTFLRDDNAISMPEPRPAIEIDGDAVMLNFEQAPLTEVVHSILGDTLNLDYVIEHPVGGEITIRTRSPIPRSELLPILESLLRSNDVLMIRGPNDRLFVSASPNMKAIVPSFQSEPTTGYTNIIVPLQYVSATEMADILKPVARDDAFVRIDSKRNLLVLAGTQMQLSGWLDIVSTFDVDQLAGMSVGIFPIVNSSVQEMGKELEHILRTEGGKDSSGGLSDMVRIMPVKRLNSILVVSPRSQYVEAVGEWIATLDSVEDSGSEPTLQVYPVKNADAGQLAALLSTIYGGGGRQSGRGPSVAPGMTPVTSGEGASTAGGAKSSGPMVGSISLGDGVKVVADANNNALLVYATPFHYQKIERILRKLDVVSAQVLIEASIIEVSLQDDLQYGLEWAFDNNLGGGNTGTGLLDLGGGLGPGPGFSYSITNSAGEFKAVLNALAEKSLINVISTPSVLVLDNHTASIHVGDQQPIQSTTTLTDGGNVQNSITYKDTGVKLEVTPSVNDGGLVTMDIAQSVTDVGLIDPATKQRSFRERNVNSKVAVRNGESVVLGGLILDNETEGKGGIPLLMDIPVLGSLFSTTTNKSVRTELLVFITPRVLESDEDMRLLNAEMRSRMRGLTNFEDLPVSQAVKDIAE